MTPSNHFEGKSRSRTARSVLATQTKADPKFGANTMTIDAPQLTHLVVTDSNALGILSLVIDVSKEEIALHIFCQTRPEFFTPDNGIVIEAKGAWIV